MGFEILGSEAMIEHIHKSGSDGTIQTETLVDPSVTYWLHKVKEGPFTLLKTSSDEQQIQKSDLTMDRHNYHIPLLGDRLLYRLP